MKGRIQAYETDIANNQSINNSIKDQGTPADLIKINSFSEILTSESNQSFRHYIEWLGLSHDTRLVVLSSIHHYYYDAEEMINVKTVVNLKELNQIKEINSFLHSMFLVLPPKCCLIGCFVDNKKQNGFSFRKRAPVSYPELNTEDEKNGIVSSIPFLNTIFSLLDARTNKYLSGKHVIQLLRNNGFLVMDMTELNGLTYFCAQSQRTTVN
jgi:hypothetical protein